MTENKTSQAVERMLFELTEYGCIPCAVADSIPAICKKYKRMQTALELIAGMERLTFAECTDAENIMTAAKEALSFDPLK